MLSSESSSTTFVKMSRGRNRQGISCWLSCSSLKGCCTQLQVRQLTKQAYTYLSPVAMMDVDYLTRELPSRNSKHPAYILLLPTEILLAVLYFLDVTEILTLRQVRKFDPVSSSLTFLLKTRHAPRYQLSHDLIHCGFIY